MPVNMRKGVCRMDLSFTEGWIFFQIESLRSMDQTQLEWV